MRHGEVWWADLPQPAGTRPVLVLSRDSMPSRRPEITVAYITTKARNTAVEVPLDTADGVAQSCVVNLDSINAIPKANLRQLICTLTGARMGQVRDAVVEALDLK
jgi:mRNA-degrading endonuclease toxin of MazEF toxin-antitoxin module